MVSNWGFCISKKTSFFRRLWSGIVYPERLRINFPRLLIILKNFCNSLTDLRKGLLVMASILEGSPLLPSSEIMCPKNIIDCFLTWYLVLFSFKWLPPIFKKNFLRLSSCSSKVFLYTTSLFLYTTFLYSFFPLSRLGNSLSLACPK